MTLSARLFRGRCWGSEPEEIHADWLVDPPQLMFGGATAILVCRQAERARRAESKAEGPRQAGAAGRLGSRESARQGTHTFADDLG